MMTSAPAAAGSSGAAFQAASSAVRPPPAIAFTSDDHEDIKYVECSLILGFVP